MTAHPTSEQKTCANCGKGTLSTVGSVIGGMWYCFTCARHMRSVEPPTSKIQLMPCPFCGGPAELEFDEDRHYNEERKEEHRWQVFCAAIGRACPVGPCTHCTTKDEAISQWNTRAGVETTPVLPCPHKTIVLLRDHEDCIVGAKCPSCEWYAYE